MGGREQCICSLWLHHYKNKFPVPCLRGLSGYKAILFRIDVGDKFQRCWYKLSSVQLLVWPVLFSADKLVSGGKLGSVSLLSSVRLLSNMGAWKKLWVKMLNKRRISQMHLCLLNWSFQQAQDLSLQEEV